MSAAMGDGAGGGPGGGHGAGEGVVIEPLAENHVDAALAVYAHYVETSTATFHDRPVDRDEFAGQVLFDGGRHRAFAALRDGELLGYALAGPYKSRCSYADAAEVAVYLRPDAIGRGLGRRLMERVEEHAREAGLHVLIAGVCTENAGSIALFEALGYERCAEFREVGLKFGRRLDVAYLQKLLGG